MFKVFLDKFLESFKSVLPVTIVLIILGVVMGLPTATMLWFLLGALLLVIGLALFQLGAFESTSVIAEDIGRFIVKKKKPSDFCYYCIYDGFFHHHCRTKCEGGGRSIK